MVNSSLELRYILAPDTELLPFTTPQSLSKQSGHISHVSVQLKKGKEINLFVLQIEPSLL